jgi:hypothetical protein
MPHFSKFPHGVTSVPDRAILCAWSLNPPGTGRAEKVPSTVLPFLSAYWKVLLPAALAMAAVCLWAYVSGLKADNARMEAESASHRTLIRGLSDNLRERKDAAARREAEIEEIDRTYKGRRAAAGAAMRKSPEAAGWADHGLPPAVVDVLRPPD